MAFVLTVNNDHTLTFSDTVLARQNEAGVSVTVNVGTDIQAFGATYLSYVDFLLPDGTPYFKGTYDASGGSFIMTLGATDTILEQDGKIGIQFVVRDVAPPNSAEVWKSELKYAKILSSANATSHALEPVIPPLTFPATFPAENVSIADAGVYFAATNAEDALQEVGADIVAITSDIDDLEDGTVPAGDATLAFGLTKAQLMLEIYPVGSIYIGVVSTSPATLFGGTWSAFGAGKVLVGIDAGQTEFDTVEETGGEKTHVLTEAELASHSHMPNYPTSATGGSNYFGGLSNTAPGYVTTAVGDTNIATDTAGSGTAHNNLQPYIVTYMWKRVS